MGCGLRVAGGGSDNYIFFKNLKIQSEFAYKSESDIDILKRVEDVLLTPLPLTRYRFAF